MSSPELSFLGGGNLSLSRPRVWHQDSQLPTCLDPLRGEIIFEKRLRRAEMYWHGSKVEPGELLVCLDLRVCSSNFSRTTTEEAFYGGPLIA